MYSLEWGESQMNMGHNKTIQPCANPGYEPFPYCCSIDLLTPYQTPKMLKFSTVFIVYGGIIYCTFFNREIWERKVGQNKQYGGGPATYSSLHIFIKHGPKIVVALFALELHRDGAK